MKSSDLLVEFYDPEDDQSNSQVYDDRRRPRLTLKHLGKLRRSKDMEKVDNEIYKNFVPTMYDIPEEPSI